MGKSARNGNIHKEVVLKSSNQLGDFLLPCLITGWKRGRQWHVVNDGERKRGKVGVLVALATYGHIQITSNHNTFQIQFFWDSMARLTGAKRRESMGLGEWDGYYYCGLFPQSLRLAPVRRESYPRIPQCCLALLAH